MLLLHSELYGGSNTVEMAKEVIHYSRLNMCHQCYRFRIRIVLARANLCSSCSLLLHVTPAELRNVGGARVKLKNTCI